MCSEPNRLLKEVLATQGKGATSRQGRPLGDKTPFPNRAENYAAPDPFMKMPKLILVETDAQKVATPEIQRPSSTRRHSRSIRKSVGQNFETPVNNGRHWDVGDISIGSPEVQTQETIPEDDFDEIEYMAPNTLDIAYQPPFDFDLPDYKALGENFRKYAFSGIPYDVEPPELVLPEVELPDDAWNLLTLREIEDDDPFLQHRPSASNPIKPATASKVVPRTRPLSALPSSSSIRGPAKATKARPATATSTINPRAATRPASTIQTGVRRPATSSSSTVMRPTATGSKISAKAAVIGRQPAGKASLVDKGTTIPPKAASAPSTSRSTPTFRNTQPSGTKQAPSAAAEPFLFRPVDLEPLDDFMFELTIPAQTMSGGELPL
ncbi:hypothetical protein H1R20_g7400, partial [Candolleomyces eurysporus]